MSGRIVSRQKCPECKRTGRFVDNGRGLVCQCGRFWADRFDIRIGYQGKDHTIGFNRRGERLRFYEHARRVLGEIRSLIEHQEFYPGDYKSGKSNDYLFKNYLERYAARERMRLLPERLGTYQAKAGTWRHLAWLGDKNIKDIRAGDLQDFANLPCLRMALAPSYLKSVLAELKHIFIEALNREDIARIPKMPTIKVVKPKIVWMYPEQQEAVIEAMPEVHRPLFRFMMLYGVRRGEACGLCWDMVDRTPRENFPYGTVTIARTRWVKDLKDRTKGGRARVLPIFEEFAAYLDSIPHGIGKTPVFKYHRAQEARSCEFYNSSTVTRIWKMALRKAGLPHIPRKNGTRHSWGMSMRNLAQMDLNLIGSFLGHAGSRITREHYAEDGTELLMGMITEAQDRVRKFRTASVQPDIDRSNGLK